MIEKEYLMATQNAITDITEEQRLTVDRAYMKNGVDPSDAKQVQEAITNDSLTQELLDSIPGAEQLTPEQRRSLLNQMSLQDVSPAMKAGRNYYDKFTSTNRNIALDDQQLEMIETVQEKTLTQLQAKGEMLKGMNPIKAGFNGALPTQDLERAAAPNHMETPNLGPSQDGPAKNQR
jgi:hypothetical protein